MKLVNLTGKVFGRLTIIGPHCSVAGNKPVVHWKCKCTCGKESWVSAWHLVSGNTKSCGCLKFDFGKGNHFGIIHGETAGGKISRLYRIWTLMKTRCYNRANKAFKNYGGRGIKVCDDWFNSPEKFFNWAKTNGYKSHLEIDRKDNNGDYTPQNCRWVTRLVNVSNRRNTLFVIFNNTKITLAEAARILGVNYYVFYNWIKRGTIANHCKQEIIYEA